MLALSSTASMNDAPAAHRWSCAVPQTVLGGRVRRESLAGDAAPTLVSLWGSVEVVGLSVGGHQTPAGQNKGQEPPLERMATSQLRETDGHDGAAITPIEKYDISYICIFNAGDIV